MVSGHSEQHLLDVSTNSEDFTSYSEDEKLKLGKKDTNDVDDKLVLTIQGELEWDVGGMESFDPVERNFKIRKELSEKLGHLPEHYTKRIEKIFADT